MRENSPGLCSSMNCLCLFYGISYINLFKLGDGGIWTKDKPGIWTIFEAFIVLLEVILYYTIPFVFEKSFFCVLSNNFFY